MTFSQFAGIAVVPTLARLVLAGAFITAGWGKFTEGEFTADQGAQLQRLGVSTIVVMESTPPPGAGSMSTPVITTVSMRQVTIAPTTQPDTSPAKAPTTAPASIVARHRASRMHFVTLMVDEQGWPYPVWAARLAAFTELIGGGLILIGLFSRLWGLGLACVMGVAFYLTSLPAILDNGPHALTDQQYSTAYLQLALFVLAFGVLLTGAGLLSLDRLLFGRRDPDIEAPHEPIRLPG
jgi:uncharacterized membrane protein YphA (DoxX/SURF4 family)